jgi:hypothetical protein
MDQQVHEHELGVGRRQTLDRGRPAVRGAVVDHPEDTPRPPVGRRRHDLIDEPAEGHGAGGWLAAAEQAGAVHVPGGQVDECAAALVLVLHAAICPRTGRAAEMAASQHLQPRLLVGADHVNQGGSRGLARPRG